ncbi:mannonate oxidoreductase [Clostridioides sp. ES-S-0048-02]|nr:mannonate oxidoreductase [Clostridioides sp. ES-S-0048-02]
MGMNYFSKLLESTTEKELLLNKKSNNISTARLISFLILIAGFAIGFYNKNIVGIFVGIVALILFISLLVIHNKIKEEESYFKSKCEVLDKYVKRFGDEWKEFKIDGKEYIQEENSQAKDLDLFGRASLYQYICIANTSYGKKSLAKSLWNENPNDNIILERQTAVKELLSKQDFSIHIQTLSNIIGKEQKTNSDGSIESFIEYGEDKKVYIPKWMHVFTWGLPTATILSFIFFILGFLPMLPVFLLFVLQLGFGGFGNTKLMQTLSPLFSFSRSIQVYEKMFEVLEKETFESPYLKELQAKLSKGNGVSKGIKQLNSIGNAVNLRYNQIVYILACGVLMWNYHCAESLERWKSVYGNQIRGWLESIGEFEALISLTIIGQVKENTCFPIIKSESIPKLEVEEVYHPLIAEKTVVANSIKLNSQTCIITGSNMSGKTTFLRSIGVNLVLAYAGAPVCAKNFDATCMYIFTSMRIQDDVSQGISTFYAEILRIKSMIQYSIKELPMLVLVDEIFKGTNSADRIIGASEAVKKLSKPWIISMVTTHDFELCDLSSGGDVEIVNYHFSEYYVDDKIYFDYAIKDGRCKTTNAKQLMKMAGIL